MQTGVLEFGTPLPNAPGMPAPRHAPKLIAAEHRFGLAQGPVPLRNNGAQGGGQSTWHALCSLSLHAHRLYRPPLCSRFPEGQLGSSRPTPQHASGERLHRRHPAPRPRAHEPYQAQKVAASARSAAAAGRNQPTAPSGTGPAPRQKTAAAEVSVGLVHNVVLGPRGNAHPLIVGPRAPRRHGA